MCIVWPETINWFYEKSLLRCLDDWDLCYLCTCEQETLLMERWARIRTVNKNKLGSLIRNVMVSAYVGWFVVFYMDWHFFCIIENVFLCETLSFCRLPSPLFSLKVAHLKYRLPFPILWKYQSRSTRMAAWTRYLLLPLIKSLLALNKVMHYVIRVWS